ncbi:hypothetical protein RCL1_008675 [Eukaryota sp. TZLM3-RCL]
MQFPIPSNQSSPTIIPRSLQICSAESPVPRIENRFPQDRHRFLLLPLHFFTCVISHKRRDCFVYRRLDGDLSQLVNAFNYPDSTPLPIDEALVCFFTIYDVVQSMHNPPRGQDTRYVHRDLKSANVLYLTDRDNPSYRDYFLADIGHAQEVDISGTRDTLSVATALYRSPELVESWKNEGGPREVILNRPRSPYDAVSLDLWSLGVILYEISTGKYPFFPCSNLTNDYIAFEDLVLNSEPDYSIVPADVRDIIQVLLIKNPVHRKDAFKQLKQTRRFQQLYSDYRPEV